MHITRATYFIAATESVNKPRHKNSLIGFKAKKNWLSEKDSSP